MVMVMIMNMIMLIQLIVALQFLQEGARIQAQLTLSLTTLAKTKEKYEKVFNLNKGSPPEKSHNSANFTLSRHLVQVKEHWSATTRRTRTSTCPGLTWRSRG